MKSAKCAQCGFVGWSDAEFCKKCGAPVSSAPADMLERSGDNFTASYASYDTPSAELKTGLAITSLVMGIANFLLLGIFVVPTIIGIIVSVVALNKIKREPHEYGGKSLAIGGLVTNIVSAVLLVPVMMIAAIAIPNLLAARMAANEGAAIRSLRVLHGAEQTYQANYGQGEYGTLTELQKGSLISTELANGVKSGYRLKVEVYKASSDGPASFAVMAVPTDYGSSGRRSFFIDETGVIRGEDNHGLEASKSTPPVNLNRRYPERESDMSRSSRYGDDN
jgi:type II secretory pathway pseudopilin PulG